MKNNVILVIVSQNLLTDVLCDPVLHTYMHHFVVLDHKSAHFSLEIREKPIYERAP